MYNHLFSLNKMERLLGEDDITITSGTIRKLTKEEKRRYPRYKYVTLSSFYYECGNYTIVVPSDFLTDGLSGGPDYGSSWMFHDFLYASHRFSSGQECTREEADKVMEQVLSHERMNIYCWIFVRFSKLNPLWLFSRAWKKSGERGPEYLE